MKYIVITVVGLIILITIYQGIVMTLRTDLIKESNMIGFDIIDTNYDRMNASLRGEPDKRKHFDELSDSLRSRREKLITKADNLRKFLIIKPKKLR